MSDVVSVADEWRWQWGTIIDKNTVFFMDERENERTNGLSDGRKDGLTDGRTDGLTD